MAAADELEKLLPALSKNALPEQTLVGAEKIAGSLGQQEPSSGERLAMLLRLTDADLQHALDLAAEKKDAPAKLVERTTEIARGLPRSVDAVLQELVSSEHQHSARKAAVTAEQSVPRALDAAKSRDAQAAANESERSHMALDSLAESFAPSSDLSLLEMRDRAGNALEGMMKPGNTKFSEMEQLAPLRAPLLRALAAALRRAENKADLNPKAEELARLWASLPEKTRAGDAADVTEAAGRMEELLDELMKGTNAFSVGLIDRIEADLGRLQNAVRDGEQQEAQALAQGVVSDLKDLESANSGNDLVKQAKAASIQVIKKVPEALQDPSAIPALDKAVAQLRLTLAKVRGGLAPGDDSKFRENVAFIGSALHGDGDADEAVKRAARLGSSPQAQALQGALRHWSGRQNDPEAIASARRKLRAVGLAAERATDPDVSLDKAKVNQRKRSVFCCNFFSRLCSLLRV